jgi:asparagine N-glycosylation enzyme membrane subunit Stt3
VRRAAEAVAAAGLVAGAALGAGASAGVLTNLSALAAGNRWYLSIVEFQPLTTFSGVGGTLADFAETTGASLLALPLGAVATARRWRSGDRTGALFLAVWLGLFLTATLVRRRFLLYLAPPLALAVAAGLQLAAERFRGVPGRLREAALLVGMAVLLSLPGLRPLGGEFPVGGVDALAPALAWLRETPVRNGRPAVLSDWTLGHVVRYFARRPVVASPFGVDGGVGAMEDTARFFLAEDAEAAEAVLRARRVGVVVLQNVPGEVFIGEELVPSPEHVRLRSRSVDVYEFEVTERFWSLVSSRLYFRDGVATSRSEAIAARLFETPPEASAPVQWACTRSSRWYRERSFGQ